MQSAVPATGMVKSAATRQTPPHRALAVGKNSPPNSQQARRRKKIEGTCQRKSPTSSGKRVIRNENAIRIGKNVRLACDEKNSCPAGNNFGSKRFPTPGRKISAP